ncbi:MAG: type II secretion system GspH family protein [Tenericutes bacterium]|nr:type II secretion system GspH family protein [Mycoplasmatota bacterium]
MNKKGFTLMEIIVVIALLGAIMLLVVPNITKNFKDSKKRLFYDNVVSLYTSAGRSFLLLDNPSNKTFSNSGNTLDVDVSDDITYKIVVNSYGEVTSIYVTNGTYSYSKSNSNGIKKKDIKLDDIVEGTGGEDVSAKVTLFDKLLEDNPTISERTDFSTPFTTNTANTLYKATENGTDVYYFAGQDTESTPINNWVKFGKNSSNQDLYWRIIRTNSDGSIRLLYHETSPDTREGYIGKSTFNANGDSPKYVGYMYGDTDDTLEEARTNTNDSTIKTYIDNWYANNMTSYTKYLSTTAVYCNDRELASESTYTNGITQEDFFDFKSYDRLVTNKQPTYDCTNDNDKFTVDASAGNGKLTYPIALMTADEIAYAGGVYFTNAPMWYYTNSRLESSTGTTYWWSLSPSDWDGNDALSGVVNGSADPGNLLDIYVLVDSGGIRPVVSLKTCIKYRTGNGTSETPYEIVETSSGC